MKIGILAVQGDFAAHAATLRGLGAESVELRTVSDLDGCDGIILPGPLELYLTLLLTTIVGILLGLFISAIAANSNSVIYIVLLAVFVQIIFAGVFFELPGAARAISFLTPTRWSVEALGSIIDMPALNALGQIEVRRTVDTVDPTTGAKVQRDVVYSDKLPLAFTIGYEHQAGYLLSRWAVLLIFALLLLIGTAWAQGRFAERRHTGRE